VNVTPTIGAPDLPLVLIHGCAMTDGRGDNIGSGCDAADGIVMAPAGDDETWAIEVEACSCPLRSGPQQSFSIVACSQD
jgi:hypothetical protein